MIRFIRTNFDIQFLFSFNAAPGTGAAMRSLAARLSIMTNEERKELKMEIRECLGTIGLNLKTLHKMRKLDNLVCEVQLFCLAGNSGLPLFAPRITPSFRSFFCFLETVLL